MHQQLSKTPAKNQQKPSKKHQNARFLDVFTHARARQCMVQKIGRGGNEGGEGKEEKEEEEEEEKEEDEEEDEEDEEEDKEDEEDEEDEQEEEDEKDEEEEEDEAKRREEGRGGGSLSKISSEETLSKLRLKLNQNKAKSTKHAGRPADFDIYFDVTIPIHCIQSNGSWLEGLTETGSLLKIWKKLAAHPFASPGENLSLFAANHDIFCQMFQFFGCWIRDKDICSSWISHYPTTKTWSHVSITGMNVSYLHEFRHQMPKLGLQGEPFPFPGVWVEAEQTGGRLQCAMDETASRWFRDGSKLKDR